MKQILESVKSTILHPQWLSLRFHRKSRRWLREIKGSNVLDIGSGDSKQADLLGPQCRLWRLDYPVTNARYRTPPDIYADACHLPLADNKFDAVLLLEVLEHVSDDRQALCEIHRVLKPGGKLYISVPFIYPLHDKPADFHRYTSFGIARLLQEKGFVVLNEFHHGNSFITAAYLFNMALLELTRDLFIKSRIAGLVTAFVFYPFCIIVNLLSWPLLLFKQPRASCLGHFVIASCG